MNKGKKVVRSEQKQVRMSGPMDQETKAKIGIGVGIVAFLVIVFIVCYDTFHKDPVLAVGEDNYYLSDTNVMYNVYSQEAAIERTDQFYKQYTNSTTSYWDTDGIREQAKQTAMDNTISAELLYREAVAAKKTLSDDDKKSVKEQVEELLDNMPDKILKNTGFTKESLTSYLEKEKLASNFKNEKIEGYGVSEDDVKDSVKEEDYDQRKIQYIIASKVMTNDEGDKKNIDEDTAKKYKTQLNTFLEKAKAGKDMSTLVDKEDQEYFYTEDTFILGKGTVPDEVEEACANLKNGEFADGIIETDERYYIIKMVDNDCKDAYNQAIDSAIESEEEGRWATELAELEKKYNVEVLTKGWDRVTLGEVAVIPGEGVEKPTPTPAVTAGDATDVSKESESENSESK